MNCLTCRIPIKVISIVALVVGAATGWFAAGIAEAKGVSHVEGKRQDDPCASGIESAAKPRRKAPIRSTADAGVRKRALEKRVHFLEDRIRIVEEKKTPKTLDATTASNAEIVERLMKLPTEWEREKELDRLGTNRIYTFTVAQLGKLCPKKYFAPGKKVKEWHDKAIEKTAARLAILDSVDQSLMTEGERTLHSDFVDSLSRLPGIYAEKLVLEDSVADKTWGELVENVRQLRVARKRMDALLAEERKMLLSQAARHFDIPDNVAAELQATVDDVSAYTDPTVFFRK